MNVLKGQVVAQLAHVGWGGLLTFTFVHWLPLLDSIGIVVAIAAIKELLEALGWAFWEPKDTWSDSAVDFLFFLLGMAWAVLVLR